MKLILRKNFVLFMIIQKDKSQVRKDMSNSNNPINDLLNIDLDALEEQGQKTTKSRKKNITIGVIAAMLVVIMIVAVTQYIIPVMIPNMKYARAEGLLEKGEYQEAISAFEQLGNYKDAPQRAVEAEKEERYAKGIELIESGQFEEAEQIYESLGEYRDAANQKIEAKYLLACSFKESAQYDKAIAAFTELEEYKDSLAQIDLCRGSLYDNAVSLMHAKDYVNAAQKFQEIKGYRDSEDLWKNCATIIATDYESAGDDKMALSWYIKIEDTDNANRIRYEYVLAHKDSKDTTTYDYLAALKKQKYRDSEKIYNSLYKFGVELSFDNYNLYYKITGGPPKGTVPIRIVNEAYWTNGRQSSQDIVDDITLDAPVGVREKSTDKFFHAYRHTITVFNAETGEKIGQIVDPYK
nr:hypothetical protein [uncultured Dysosmobacter sp.]